MHVQLLHVGAWTLSLSLCHVIVTLTVFALCHYFVGFSNELNKLYVYHYDVSLHHNFSTLQVVLKYQLQQF